jgi:hypothetical protein
MACGMMLWFVEYRFTQGPVDGFVTGLVGGGELGFTFGLLIALLFSLLAGLTGGEIEQRISPNQGIKRSGRTGTFVGLPVGLVVGLLIYLLLQGVYGPYGKSETLGVAVVAGSTLTLVVGLSYGWYACISHAALRLTLWRINALPLSTIHFLDYATDRVFLRRVGGGYIFVHRLLQEYFASLATAGSELRGSGTDGSGKNRRTPQDMGNGASMALNADT